LAQETRAILIICDGLGDRPVESLGGRTPLEAAPKPNMDRLAAGAECGLMDPIAPGVRAGSDTSHLAILGYDPYECYTGRGPFEAAGIGMDVQKGDVAFRCNFTTVDADLTVLDRRAGRISENTHELAEAVNGMQIGEVTALFKESVEHRGALVLRGPGLGADVTDTDTHKDFVNDGVRLRVLESRPCRADDDASARTASAVNEFVRRSYEILKEHPVNKAREAAGLPPANIILPRGAGLAPHLSNFDEAHGLRSACIAETGLIRGVAKYVGMQLITAPGATGGLDSDIMSFGRTIIEALKDHTFILTNIKGCDIAGHDDKPKVKIEMIQRIDAMLGYLLENVPRDTYIVLTADHSTPCAVKDHSGDPVPIAFWGPGVRVDSVKRFDERSVAAGIVGRIRGVDVVPIITQLMTVQEKFGA